METISIKELHAATGKWARAAKTTPIIVTDHGEQVAELRPLVHVAAPKFPKRDWSNMPASKSRGAWPSPITLRPADFLPSGFLKGTG